MKTYFAYGSNLLLAQMNDRCPEHTCLGVGELHDYRFLINERGYATVTPDKGQTVWGVLYTLSETDEATLDRCEGVAGGWYRKESLPIETKTGDREALVYLDDRTKTSQPREGYLEKIIAGAQEHLLPEGYLAFLKSFSRA